MRFISPFLKPGVYVEVANHGNGAETIPLFKVFMPESVMEPLRETLLSGYIGQGPRVEEFESLLSKWYGHPNVLTLNSGTSALQLALRLANVSNGDFVVSTPMSCLATNTAIRAVGAHPIWADINPRKIQEACPMSAKAIPRT